MQGLADGYFILPVTIGDYLAGHLGEQPTPTGHPAFKTAEQDVSQRVRALLAVDGRHSVDHFHRELGRVLWEQCGMARDGPGLEQAIDEVAALREQFHADVRVLGDGESLNQSLEKAGRVSDYFELAELMCRDALHREESCGSHFREEHQTPDHEALRDDDNFAYVGVWEHGGAEPHILHKEELTFRNVHPTQRNYA
jgi:succinate dehydrogenase / fumarate reductase flavoprotein subunit